MKDSYKTTHIWMCKTKKNLLWENCALTWKILTRPDHSRTRHQCPCNALFLRCRFQFEINTWRCNCFRRLKFVRAVFRHVLEWVELFRHFACYPHRWVPYNNFELFRTQRFDVFVRCSSFKEVNVFLPGRIQVISTAKSSLFLFWLTYLNV